MHGILGVTSSLRSFNKYKLFLLLPNRSLACQNCFLPTVSLKIHITFFSHTEKPCVTFWVLFFFFFFNLLLNILKIQFFFLQPTLTTFFCYTAAEHVSGYFFQWVSLDKNSLLVFKYLKMFVSSLLLKDWFRLTSTFSQPFEGIVTLFSSLVSRSYSFFVWVSICIYDMETYVFLQFWKFLSYYIF